MHAYDVVTSKTHTYAFTLRGTDDEDIGRCFGVVVGLDMHLLDVQVPHIHRGKGFCQEVLTHACEFVKTHITGVEKIIIHTNIQAMIGCAEAVGFKSVDDQCEWHMEKSV